MTEAERIEAEQIAALKEFQRPHLLMTVGGNTLPNAVAGPLLVSDGGTITLIHSADTHNIAERCLKPVLERLLTLRGRKNVTVRLAGTSVDESDSASIRRVIAEEIKKVPGQSVGLHYTGGTKAMSVHAFREVETLTGQEPLFSYLNHRKLEIVLETASVPHAPKPVSMVTIPFRQLLELHGGDYDNPARPGVTTPVWPEVTKALADYNAPGNDISAWTDWKKFTVRNWWQENNKPQDRGLRAHKNSVERALAREPDIALTVNPPCPRPIADAFRRQLGFDGDFLPLAIAERSLTVTHSHPRSAVFEWLDGKWLEHWALMQLNAIAPAVGLHGVQANVEATFNGAKAGYLGSDLFELDAVAVRGYQVFALSCGLDRKLAKTKLFEAFTRAKQIGGEEARVALLTTLTDEQAKRTAREASELLMLKGQIKIFSRVDLLNLQQVFTEWMTP